MNILSYTSNNLSYLVFQPTTESKQTFKKGKEKEKAECTRNKKNHLKKLLRIQKAQQSLNVEWTKQPIHLNNL